MSPKPKTPDTTLSVVIAPPRIRAVKVKIIGTAPYMQARFSEKAMHAMMAKMDGTTTNATSKSKRPPRDYDEDYHAGFGKAITRHFNAWLIHFNHFSLRSLQSVPKRVSGMTTRLAILVTVVGTVTVLCGAANEYIMLGLRSDTN